MIGHQNADLWQLFSQGHFDDRIAAVRALYRREVFVRLALAGLRQGTGAVSFLCSVCAFSVAVKLIS